jgi:4-aminobutyrate aminotransferase-like enzyme
VKISPPLITPKEAILDGLKALEEAVSEVLSEPSNDD